MTSVERSIPVDLGCGAHTFECKESFLCVFIIFFLRLMEGLLKSACRHRFSIYSHQQEAEKNITSSVFILGD